MTTRKHYHLVRNRPTWQAYIHFGIFGYFFYAFAVTVALLRDEHGYTRSVASLHGTATALAAIVVGLTVSRVVRLIGRGVMLRLASVLMVVGLLIYTAFDHLVITLLGAFLASAGAWLVMVGINAFLPDHHGAASPRALSEAHGFGATLGLLAPLAVGAGVAMGWGWRPGLLVTCVALVALETWRGRRLEPFDSRHRHPEDQDGNSQVGPMPRLFWKALAVFAVATGTEFCLALWGSDLLRDRAGLGEAAAAAALATIVGGLTVGRLVGSTLVSHFEPDVVLVCTLSLTIVGFAIAWVSTSAVIMLVGFTVTGLGLGLQSPLAVGRAVLAAGGQVDRASGLTSVAVGVAGGIAPFLLASVADQFGVHIGFLIVPLLSVTGIVLVLVGRVPIKHLETSTAS